MHAMRGIADEREAVADVAAGEMRLQRPRLARTVERDRAELAAEAPLDLGEKACVVERHDARPVRLVLGPGDAGTVALERQDREWARGQEVLHRACFVRTLMAHGRDNADLRVAPADDADAGRLAQPGVAPLGGNEKRGVDLAPIGQAHAFAGLARGKVARFPLYDPLNRRSALCRRVERIV